MFSCSFVFKLNSASREFEKGKGHNVRVPNAYTGIGVVYLNLPANRHLYSKIAVRKNGDSFQYTDVKTEAAVTCHPAQYVLTENSC